MHNNNGNSNAFILGIFFCLGMGLLGYLAAEAALKFKSLERSVTVKGLSEREVPADIVIWPIRFSHADNKLEALYNTLEQNTLSIQKFLQKSGLTEQEISISAPSITDKSAQQYGNSPRAEFRYAANQTVTVYSGKITLVRNLMKSLGELGKRGIVFSGEDYQSQAEYLFTGLNQIKPDMIQNATTKAREVARKFAEDSASRLGKIKRASQGNFSISARDRNNPHIKKVRVVSTIEYYLSD